MAEKRTVTTEWGMRCPQCGRDDQIDITAHVSVRLTANGTDADASQSGDHTWDEQSPADCAACGYSGTVADFRTEEVNQ